MDRRRPRPSPPTSSLPPLSRLTDYSFVQVANAFQNLRAIYADDSMLTLAPAVAVESLLKHHIHDTSVPDSGYASAEEDDDDEDINLQQDDDGTQAFNIDVLRSDVFEREYAIRWLTGFTARSDVWIRSADSEADSDARAALVDTAASILTTFTGDDEEEALTRRFTFPTDGGEIVVELNDAPLLSEDHTSVGLQSWGSSILLAERLCASPLTFGLSAVGHDRCPRVLELGAGTGLLSIVTAKIMRRLSDAHGTSPSIVATDYHPSVLVNLRSNVDTNFCSSAHPETIAVRSLDWQRPVYDGELALPFDVLLAADVVYHPRHTRWIKDCVERLLVRPDSSRSEGGIFWLIIPLRPTGRHEGMCDTVEEVFPRPLQPGKYTSVSGGNFELGIIDMWELERHEGVGRADEGGYRLYKIGWVCCA